MAEKLLQASENTCRVIDKFINLVTKHIDELTDRREIDIAYHEILMLDNVLAFKDARCKEYGKRK